MKAVSIALFSLTLCAGGTAMGFYSTRIVNARALEANDAASSAYDHRLSPAPSLTPAYTVGQAYTDALYRPKAKQQHSTGLNGRARDDWRCIPRKLGGAADAAAPVPGVGGHATGAWVWQCY